MLDIMSMVMLCSDLCVRMLFSVFCVEICIHTCLYAWIHVLPCLCASFHMFVCLDLCLHMLVCSILCSGCFMLSSMCLCAPCHICVLRPRLCLSCHVLLYPFCRFIFLLLAYWFGPDLDPMVFVIIHTPRPTSKGWDHLVLHVYAYLLLCFLLVLASLVPSFDTIDALSKLWLCGYIQRLWGLV